MLIDGLHIYDQVVKDIAGCLPHLAEGADLLCHDAFHIGVSRAIREAVEADIGIYDCGYVCSTPHTGDPLVAYSGFRMLRFASARVADPGPLIDGYYRSKGMAPPVPDADLINHDGWYCRRFEPCPRCRAAAESK